MGFRNTQEKFIFPYFFRYRSDRRVERSFFETCLCMGPRSESLKDTQANHGICKQPRKKYTFFEIIHEKGGFLEKGGGELLIILTLL